MTTYEYVGNLHIHSRNSDGAGSLSEIVRAAGKAGLDFIILNDHAHMTDSLHLEDEGRHDGLLVLMGLEMGRRYHHYLVFGLSQMITSDGLGPQEVIDLVHRKGGFGFLAHPFEKGMPYREKSIAYTWNDLSVTGYTGICIWNFSSRWKERVKSPLHGLFHLLFKSWTLKGPSRKTLSFWDERCRQEQVPAIGGSDAHGSSFKWGVFRFTPLPYDHTLNSINVHLLLESPLSEDFREAKEEIYGALKGGRLFIAHDRLAPAEGFRFSYTPAGKASVTMGVAAPFRPGKFLMVSPRKGEIRLLKDGTVLRKWFGRKVTCEVGEGGVYRVEVYRRVPLFGLRPWIFSNPIYLR